MFISYNKKSFEIALKCNVGVEKNSHLSQFQIHCQKSQKSSIRRNEVIKLLFKSVQQNEKIAFNKYCIEVGRQTKQVES